MRIHFGLAILSMVGCFPTTASAEAITFNYGAECRKNDTGGCTGDQTSCYSAPQDRIIIQSSVKVTNTHSGKSPRCIVGYRDMRKVPVTTAGGMKFDLNEPTKLCINAHIESGGGPKDLGKGFNVKCTATFNLVETD